MRPVFTEQQENARALLARAIWLHTGRARGAQPSLAHCRNWWTQNGTEEQNGPSEFRDMRKREVEDAQALFRRRRPRRFLMRPQARLRLGGLGYMTSAGPAAPVTIPQVIFGRVGFS
jgi:hypothetical protein